MPDPSLVTPQDPNAAVPTVAPTDAPQGPVIPPSLTKVPAIQGLLAGAPPAVSVVIKDFKNNPLEKEIVENKDALGAAGFGFYRSLSGHIAVMFNRFHIHPEDIKAADRAGKLQVLAPPLAQVDHALAGKTHALKNAKFPTAFASPQPPIAPQAGAQAAQAANQGEEPPQAAPAAGAPNQALARKLLAARLQNIQPGAPTSGAAPGGGRLLNSVLKQVV